MSPFRPDFSELSPVFLALLGRCPGLGAFGRFPTVDELNAEARRLGLTTGDGLPLTFVPAPKKSRRKRRKDPASLPYELRVAARGEVETRADSWHDFFNALTWTVYPELKAALNARQIAAREEGRVRTREQDRLAIFDEGGVIRYGGVGAPEYVVVGHALYESLVEGKSGIRALVLDVELPAQTSAAPLATRVDHAQKAAAARVASACFAAEGVVWPDCLLDEVAR